MILSIHFAFVASAAALGQTAQSVDIAGDWILALERYGQTDYQRMKLGDRFGEAESLFTHSPLARAEGRDADVVGLLGDARRRRVEIGDRPGIAECHAELARLPQRPVPA